MQDNSFNSRFTATGCRLNNSMPNIPVSVATQYSQLFLAAISFESGFLKIPSQHNDSCAVATYCEEANTVRTATVFRGQTVITVTVQYTDC